MRFYPRQSLARGQAAANVVSADVGRVGDLIASLKAVLTCLKQTTPETSRIQPKIAGGPDMITSWLKWSMIAGLAGFAGVVQAEDIDIGKSEFQAACASCHGADGKGKGPVSGQLKVPPSDLTMLARSNNGVFPTNAVFETIHGSKTIPAHGTREMPIWGERFNPIVSLPHHVDSSYWKMAGVEQRPEIVVRTRILAVVDYLSRIQQK